MPPAIPTVAGLTAQEMAGRLNWFNQKLGGASAKQLLAVFKKQLVVDEISQACIVQTIGLPDLARHLRTTLPLHDPVWTALHKGPNPCARVGVDVLSSIKVLAQLKQDKLISKGCVILAWSLQGGALRQLVGAAVVSEFIRHPDLGTKVLEERDLNWIGDFVGKHAYIDTMCSSKPGVGKLLVRHAYLYACKHFEGLTALAMHGKTEPRFKSKEMFEQMGFRVHGEAVIKPNGTAAGSYKGAWVTLQNDREGLRTVVSTGLDRSHVCLRTGLTDKTADRLLWRC